MSLKERMDIGRHISFTERESCSYFSRGRWGAGKRTHGIHDAQSRVWAGELIWESSAEQQPTQPCELMRPSRAWISKMVATSHRLSLKFNKIKNSAPQSHYSISRSQRPYMISGYYIGECKPFPWLQKAALDSRAGEKEFCKENEPTGRY